MQWKTDVHNNKTLKINVNIFPGVIRVDINENNCSSITGRHPTVLCC